MQHPLCADRWVHEFGPRVFLEVAGEESSLAAELDGLQVHVVHELVG